jgi:hypothetical protein
MAIIGESKEKIDGLVKLIIQEPRLVPELKIIAKKFKENNLFSKEAGDPNYFKTDLEILKKAETIANESLWYLFNIYDTFKNKDIGYMLYKRVNNRMIPLEKSFEEGSDSEIYEDSNILSLLEIKKIKNMVTYSPLEAQKVYSQIYEPEDEEDLSTDYAHSHREINDEMLRLIKSKDVKVTILSEEQTLEFEKDLEILWDESD